MTAGLILTAPASGGGKTVLTLSLLRQLKDRGMAPAPAKAGPDYIDPAFHSLAAGRECYNLDPWAMREETLAQLVSDLETDSGLVLCEGVMGLFDGISTNIKGTKSSTADLAAMTGWPVVLVLDVKGQGASAAAVARGFVSHREDVKISGILLNRVAGDRHEAALRDALYEALPSIQVLGAIPDSSELKLPSRHLGLIQAGEHEGIETFLEKAGSLIGRYVDLDALCALAAPSKMGNQIKNASTAALPPLGQHIAVARDEAFAFSYTSLLEGWRQSGAQISFFSPLGDESPETDADAIYLPGGYPELHAGQLSGNSGFLSGLRNAAANKVFIFGECGGYMILGKTLIDGEGEAHPMAGLLPLETSFAKRRIHLGYREATLLINTPFGKTGDIFRGHEFHYATLTSQADGNNLFSQRNAGGEDLGQSGLANGSVCGSFLHLIDRSAQI